MRLLWHIQVVKTTQIVQLCAQIQEKYVESVQEKSKYFTFVTVSSTRNPNLAIQFEFPKFYQIYRFVDLTAISTL